MYDLLKLLNDRSAGDLVELDNKELQDSKRFARTGERSSRLNGPAGSHCLVPTAGTRANT
jgi:hypothetical protein